MCCKARTGTHKGWVQSPGPGSGSFIPRVLTHSLTQSFVHSLANSFTLLFICLLIHSLMHVFAHSFVYSFTQVLIHLLIQSLTHPLTQQSNLCPSPRVSTVATVKGLKVHWGGRQTSLASPDSNRGGSR